MTDLETSRAKQRASLVCRAGTEEDAVPRLRSGCLSKPRAFLFGNVLRHRTAEGAVLADGDVGQALGSAGARPLLPLVEGAPRLRATSGHNHRTHVGGLEHAERRVGEILGEVDDFEPETQIRLIRPVLLHRFLVRHARNRRGEVVSDRLPDGAQHVLGHRDDVVLFDKRHLEVELGELRLAVGAEVFVTVAAGNLVVAFHAANHQQLLEQLGRLWKRVPRAWRQASRHQEVTCTLGCGAG